MNSFYQTSELTTLFVREKKKPSVLSRLRKIVKKKKPPFIEIKQDEEFVFLEKLLPKKNQDSILLIIYPDQKTPYISQLAPTKVLHYFSHSRHQNECLGSLKGSLSSLAFQTKSLDLILLPWHQRTFTELREHLAEYSRVLRQGGRLIFSLTHPFYELFYEKKFLLTESIKVLRDHHLYLESLDESQIGSQYIMGFRTIKYTD